MMTSSNGNIFRVTGPLWGNPVSSPHKGQWHGAFMFSLIWARMIVWKNNREAGDLRHHRAHYDVIVTKFRDREHYRRKAWNCNYKHNLEIRVCTYIVQCAISLENSTYVMSNIPTWGEAWGHQSLSHVNRNSFNITQTSLCYDQLAARWDKLCNRCTRHI